MMKKKITALLFATLSLLSLMSLTACGGGGKYSTDPEVKAYDEAWARTHDIFGNPR